MAHSGAFWDKIAVRYSQKPVADEAAYSKKLKVTRDYFRPDMEVLEIGCGTGSTAIAHAPYVKHIHATDISSKMIEIAQSKAEAQDVRNVSFEQLAVNELNAPDQSLDAVLALNILHLLENKEDAIAKVHRMLKRGGVFVSNTVCLGDNMKFFKFIVPIGRFFGLMPLVKVFTTKDLEKSLTEAGFDIDYRWLLGEGKESIFGLGFKGVFIVAKKTA